MNELQRQHYLSSLGIDTYMPRWQLPFAPNSVQCNLASVLENTMFVDSPSLQSKQDLGKLDDLPSVQIAEAVHNTSRFDDVMDGILDSKKSLKSLSPPTTIAAILSQLDDKPKTIEPFSLSVWRPINGLLVLDARQVKLALPTEKLLHNILKTIFPNSTVTLREEVMRWPMIENSFAKRTLADARAELQTWLSVQQEIHELQFLWLMGENAASYLMKEESHFADAQYHSVSVGENEQRALILPSLNELLLKPAEKKKVFSAISHYHRGI